MVKNVFQNKMRSNHSSPSEYVYKYTTVEIPSGNTIIWYQ